MTHRAIAHIDLAALQHNLQRVRVCAPETAILAMVKGNGYGHGLLPVAQALGDADALGVARLEEALTLRQNGIEKPIVIMGGFLDAEELTLMAQYGLSAVVHHESQLQLLESASLPEPIFVWLKIDTGMHRLGFPPENIPKIHQRLKACSTVQTPIIVLSHLATANDSLHPKAHQQLCCFQQTVPPDMPASLANSAAILARPETHFDWVRPGIMLYGVSPFAGGRSRLVGSDFGLKPVMTLQTRLISILHVRAGETVGYGATWTCPEDLPLGVAAIGYGDGYPRHAPNGTPVLVNGVRCPLAGRVSMDFITIDLRHCPKARVGDTVTLWGEGLPIEEIANRAETIAYELFCQVTTRVQFVYNTPIALPPSRQ